MPNTNLNISQFCTFCDVPLVPYIRSRDYNRSVSNSLYHYYKCTKCGLVTLVNVPEDLDHYYAYGYHEVPATLEFIERRVRHEHYKIGSSVESVGELWFG